jgi:hypothetical protein
MSQNSFFTAPPHWEPSQYGGKKLNEAARQTQTRLIFIMV